MEDVNNYGHRERLRDRFVKFGGKVLYDYEILELFLCGVVKRRDIKMVAKDLLRKFGSISGILNANYDTLTTVDGVGHITALHINCLREMINRMSQEGIMSRSVLNNWNAIIDFLKKFFAGCAVEKLVIIYLDKGKRVIECVEQRTGGIDSIEIYSDEIVLYANRIKASNIIISHNHPSGDMMPSKEDVIVTKQIERHCMIASIRLLDHIIIADNGVFSFSNKGLID